MIKYECDMCGKQTEHPLDFTKVGSRQGKDYHICESCWDKVIRFIEKHKESPTE